MCIRDSALGARVQVVQVLEVAGQPAAQALGLPDVHHSAGGVAEPVNPSRVGDGTRRRTVRRRVGHGPKPTPLKATSRQRRRLWPVADPSSYRPAPGAIPDSAGVYRFRDATGRVVYVGKAKSLRSRLSSYFQD